MSAPKLAYSISDVSELTGNCPASIYDQIWSGALRAVKCGRRTLVLPADLERWLADLPQIQPKQSKPRAKMQGAAQPAS